MTKNNALENSDNPQGSNGSRKHKLHITGENLEFLVVGLNHLSAPVEVRERLALNKEQLPEALRAMGNHGMPGVCLLYTSPSPRD